MTTPTKLCSKNVCIICSSVNKRLLNILNTRCNNLPLKVVLLSILNINVDISDNIMICRSCVDKIRTIHTKVSDLQELYKKNSARRKRCSNDNQSTPNRALKFQCATSQSENVENDKSVKKCRRVLLPIIPKSTDNINKAVEKSDGFDELIGCGGHSVNNFVDHSYAKTSSKPNLSNENMNNCNKGMYGDAIRNFVSQLNYIENDGEEKLLFLTENETKLIIDAVKSRSIELLCEIIFNVENVISVLKKKIIRQIRKTSKEMVRRK